MTLQVRKAGGDHAHSLFGFENAAWSAPRSKEGAAKALFDARAKGEEVLLLAGGTDLIVDRHLASITKAKAVTQVIDLTKIEGFHAITLAGEEVSLAGGVTYWDLLENREIGARLPMLHAMAKDVGAVQIQTRGTLAGNLASASPAADGSPALLALGARLELTSAKGIREVALAEFFTGYRTTVLRPDELITRITFRIPKSGTRVTWRKVGTRLAQAISKVALAAVVETDGETISRASFGMASVAATTHALPKTAAFLTGKKLKGLSRNELESAVATDIQPIDDVRSTGEYRLHVAKALVFNAISG